MNAQIANMTINEKANTITVNGTSQHTPEFARPGHVTSNNPPKPALHDSINQSGQWQQATRKGHKKAKSTGSSRCINGSKSGGEPMPANEADRKGG